MKKRDQRAVWTDWWNRSTQYVQDGRQLGSVSYEGDRTRVYHAIARGISEDVECWFSAAEKPDLPPITEFELKRHNSWVTSHSPEQDAIEWVAAKVDEFEAAKVTRIVDLKREHKDELHELLDEYIDSIYENPPSIDDGEGVNFIVNAIRAGSDDVFNTPVISFSVKSERTILVI